MSRFYTLSVLAASGFFAVGCSPTVRTAVSHPHTARQANARVAVYNIGEEVPEKTEILGHVTVKDSGFSVDCTYDEVMGLAKHETNKAGGNGFHLTYHREPNLMGSSCHRIGGNILLIPDSAYYAGATAVTSGQPVPADASKPIPVSNPGKKTSDVFYANAGYGFVTNKMYYGDIAKGNPKQGVDFNAGLNFFSRKGLGGGVRYSGFFSSFESSGRSCRYQLHYIAPEFAMQTTTRNNKWVFRETIGIGFACYFEKYGEVRTNCNGLGMHLTVSAEYKITPHVGIGAEVGVYSARLKEMDKIVENYDEKARGGISRIALNGGMRFYF